MKIKKPQLTIGLITIFFVLNYLLPLLHVYEIYSLFRSRDPMYNFYLDGILKAIYASGQVEDRGLIIYSFHGKIIPENLFVIFFSYLVLILVPVLVILLILDPLSDILNIPIKLNEKLNIKDKKRFFTIIVSSIIILTLGQIVLSLLLLAKNLNDIRIPLSWLLLIIGWCSLILSFKLYYQTNTHEIKENSN